MLDRAAFRREQEHRYKETRGLWVQLDRKRLEAALEPVHYLRLVQDGHDIGYVQVNERVAQLHGQDGVFVVCREHLVIPPGPGADGRPGRHGDVAGRGPAAAGRRREGGPDAARPRRRIFLHVRPGPRVVDEPDPARQPARERRVRDGQQRRRGAPPVRPRRPPPSARAARARTGPAGRGRGRPGRRHAAGRQLPRCDPGRRPPFEARVGFQYLPQALAQLLPRLLPVDEPNQYPVRVLRVRAAGHAGPVRGRGPADRREGWTGRPSGPCRSPTASGPTAWSRRTTSTGPTGAGWGP